MAAKPQRAPAKKKAPAAVETSQSIEDQTSQFLKQGGKINRIESGISGQQNSYLAKQQQAQAKK